VGLPIGQGKQIFRQLTSIYGIFVFAQKNAARCIGEQNKNFELRILNYDTICIFCNI
jgi:hypothetical protein